VRCAAIAADGKSSGSLPGCRTTADWSPDGNSTSRTSSASFNLHACLCSSDIYEMGSCNLEQARAFAVDLLRFEFFIIRCVFAYQVQSTRLRKMLSENHILLSVRRLRSGHIVR
jgi:hypothetical protein